MLTGLSDLFTITALVSWEQPAITFLTFGFYFGDFYEIEAFTFFFGLCLRGLRVLLVIHLKIFINLLLCAGH